MSKLAVVYWSGTGNTQMMAESILKGAKAAGAEATLFQASEFTPAMVDDFDSIALGCPAMGAEVLEDSEFEPMYEEIKPKLAGKKLALFGSYDWGDGEWMRDWAEDCKAANCLLVSEPLIAHNEPQDEDKNACEVLGFELANA